MCAILERQRVSESEIVESPVLPPDSHVFTTPSLGLAVSISINTQAVHFSGVTRVVRETAVQAEVQRC